jgi:hypothetical protein
MEVISVFEEITIFDTLRLLFFWLSPIILFCGLLLFLSSTKTYDELEYRLQREMWGIKRKTIPLLETNIQSFHKWILPRKKTVGLVCIICSLLVFVFLKQ